MINKILYDNFEDKKNLTAIVDGNFKATYKELISIIDSLSSCLAEKGIKKGDRVGLYLPNSAEFVAGFFAISNIGAVCVPVNAKYKPVELNHYISYSEANFIITSSDLMGAVKESGHDINTFVIKGEGTDWDICGSHKSGFESNEEINDDDKVIYLFSTGSTGVPKCVARSHANLSALAENHTSTVGWDSCDKILFVIPVSHTYAFGNLISALKIGATVYMLEDFSRKKVVDTILENEITIFPAVPFMIDILSGYSAAKGQDFSCLKHVISAGAPLPEAAAREFYNNFNIYPRQLYGSSETGVISINLASDISKRLQSVGRPVNNVEVKIIDEAGKDAGIDKHGEITVRSPSMTDRYENLPAESALSFRDGFYYTGDIGKIDPEGYIYITGRKKLFINISGQKVDPTEVENVILLNEGVKEVAVAGRVNSSGAECVAAYIVSSREMKPSEIVGFCRDKISDIKIPAIIKFVEEIPKSPTGKVLRDKLE